MPEGYFETSLLFHQTDRYIAKGHPNKPLLNPDVPKNTGENQKRLTESESDILTTAGRVSKKLIAKVNLSRAFICISFSGD